MTHAPIAFQSSEGRYNFEGVAQLVNAYGEKRGKTDVKAPLSVLPSDGIKQFGDFEAVGPCRGMIYMEDLDCIYTVHPSTVYKITWDGTTATSTLIGVVPGLEPVQLSRNQKVTPQVTIKTDSGVMVLESDTLVYQTDPQFPTGVITADYVSGYTVVGQSDRIFNISSIDESLTWDGLDFATFQQRAGKLVRVFENSGELIGFCSTWMEFWRNTGNADFPFSPISFKPRGLLAANAVIKCNNTVMFPGNDGIIYQLVGYEPSRISSHSIERLIENDTAAEDMSGFAWSRAGHAFALFSGTGWTRVFDATTGVWHTRSSYLQDTWRARYSVSAWNKTIVGDALSGKLGYLDQDSYTEYSGNMIWGVDSPPLHVFPNGAIVDALHLDLATGYGRAPPSIGSNPKIMLQTSKDGGNTFGQYRELELGITGKYATRVTARHLGKFGPKGIVFRLRISDPVVRALVATDVELRPLKR